MFDGVFLCADGFNLSATKLLPADSLQPALTKRTICNSLLACDIDSRSTYRLLGKHSHNFFLCQLALQTIVFDNQDMDTQNSLVSWQLNGTTAQLQTPQLRATVDLLNPQAGLGQLVVRDESINGFVLGIASGTTTTLTKQEVSEAFIRGGDLVVTYAATDKRPTSLQIYWRATVNEQGVLLLDTILSLETDLLESFPDLMAITQLPAAAAWALSDDESTTEKIAINTQQSINLSDAPLLLQSSQLDWSYAESPHPDDRGESQLMRSTEESFTIKRQLGGRFLEKGVIRRLRIRGVFLPKADDFELAGQCLAGLETETPPLTT